MRNEILKTVSENINNWVLIDFCLNKSTLEAMDAERYPPSILEGHEDDPLDEKQSNYVEVFIYIAGYKLCQISSQTHAKKPCIIQCSGRTILSN